MQERERLETRKHEGGKGQKDMGIKGFKIDRPGPDRAVACLLPLGSFDALSERCIAWTSQVKRGVSSGHVWGMCLLPSFYFVSEMFDTFVTVV